MYGEIIIITARHSDAITLVIDESPDFDDVTISFHLVFDSGRFHEKGILSFAFDNTVDS